MAPISSFDEAMKGTPKDMEKGMEEWGKWMKKNEGAIADEGAPLGKTKRISAKGISDIRNMVGGYSIIEAESLNEAAKLFENHPHFMLKDGYVEVMEFVPMPGM
ncbi:hypothetical protein HYT00_02295 [Candidatus Giovannonibacteria bacterium]|nr:hypothetical protein [Candidatus Giovannonibacteria bacterium]